MATQNRRGYSNPGGSANLGSGVRTTTGGSYRNPRLAIEDYTAWGKMNIKTPIIKEEDQREEPKMGSNLIYKANGDVDFTKSFFNFMNNLDDKMNAMMQALIATAVDIEKFNQGNKSAGTRIRGAMKEIKSIAQDVRVEVQAINNVELV